MDLATPGDPPPPNEFIQRIQKLGSSFTSNIEICQQNIISLLGDIPLDSFSTAKMITAMIVATSESSTSSSSIFPLEEKNNWDMLLTGSSTNIISSIIPFDGTIFVSAIRSMSPSLDWSEVVQSLDNPHFWIKSKTSLQLLMLILINGIAPNPFPIGLIYRLWSINKSGQFSLLSQIIYNPDVFYVLDYPHHPVGNFGCLKVFPDETNRSIGMWKCLDLVEIIFRLGDIPSLSNQVLALLRRSPGPMVLCPDLLFLGVLQISMPMTQFRIHVLKYLVSVLLSGHSNAVPIFQFAWNFENHRVQMRQIIFGSMAAYYNQNNEDQSRLTRILEITHELKGLSELLSINQFPFVIDLAILAARRDFLKLDKFIEDKLTEHGERFAQDLCQAMKRRCPGLGTNNPLSTDTFQLIFSALQPRAAAWPIIATELTQLIGQLRSKAIPRTGSTTSQFMSGGAPSFIPINKMSEGRTSGFK
jgi:CCR4-NOT transcription complex subunit 1